MHALLSSDIHARGRAPAHDSRHSRLPVPRGSLRATDQLSDLVRVPAQTSIHSHSANGVGQPFPVVSPNNFPAVYVLHPMLPPRFPGSMLNPVFLAGLPARAGSDQSLLCLHHERSDKWLYVKAPVDHSRDG